MASINNINNNCPIYHQGQSQPSCHHSSGERTYSMPPMPMDHVTLSKEALAENRQATSGIKNEQDLNPEEKQIVNELKQRDAEVKAHEAAHMAAGGGVVQGGASYEYQTGPDGKMYAVGGEVQIDVSPERTPEATIRKMQQIRRAALAPSQPSGTDRAVAAQASQVEVQARMEKMQQTREEQDNHGTASPVDGSTESAPSQSGNPPAHPKIDLMV